MRQTRSVIPFIASPHPITGLPRRLVRNCIVHARKRNKKIDHEINLERMMAKAEVVFDQQQRRNVQSSLTLPAAYEPPSKQVSYEELRPGYVEELSDEEEAYRADRTDQAINEARDLMEYQIRRGVNKFFITRAHAHFTEEIIREDHQKGLDIIPTPSFVAPAWTRAVVRVQEQFDKLYAQHTLKEEKMCRQEAQRYERYLNDLVDREVAYDEHDDAYFERKDKEAEEEEEARRDEQYSQEYVESITPLVPDMRTRRTGEEPEELKKPEDWIAEMQEAKSKHWGQVMRVLDDIVKGVTQPQSAEKTVSAEDEAEDALEALQLMRYRRRMKHPLIDDMDYDRKLMKGLSVAEDDREMINAGVFEGRNFLEQDDGVDMMMKHGVGSRNEDETWQEEEEEDED